MAADGTYHNHTTWSDGSFTPEEIVDKAVSCGFSEVGITDHYFTLKGVANCVTDDRLDDYIEMIAELKAKYEGTIRVLGGIEIDTSAANPNRFDLPLEQLDRLDYVLFEYVDETRDYALSDLIRLRKRLSTDVGLAHPDVTALIEQYGAEPLAKVLAGNDIFLDACGSARDSRPTRYHRYGIDRAFTLNIEGLGEDFKEAAKRYGVRFAPSADTHRDDSSDSLADTRNAIDAIERYDLPEKEF